MGQLIQRLSDLSREDLLDIKDPAGKVVARQHSQAFGSENLALAQQARGLIERIPDHVSASEYLTVALAFDVSGRSEESHELAQRGLLKPGDALTLISLRRMNAKALYQLGRAREGREQLDVALSLADSLPVQERSWAKSSQQIFWSALEKNAGNCVEMAVRGREAERGLKAMPASARRSQLEEHLRGVGNDCR
ncbi:hypothetical protein [Micromonospora cremea]|uniref:Tetratricopeptide repeat-containing protein n=1 Tax=Micromonospora cremea TaxID=709881 RepID=A0A1N6ARR9_9ACTN|nr:hypothetical protein [Micromonospora cremea]SIN36730.1 hypothetical protein SAMN04489832_6027 [Micromonospora cremea]